MNSNSFHLFGVGSPHFSVGSWKSTISSPTFPQFPPNFPHSSPLFLRSQPTKKFQKINFFIHFPPLFPNLLVSLPVNFPQWEVLVPAKELQKRGADPEHWRLNAVWVQKKWPYPKTITPSEYVRESGAATGPNSHETAVVPFSLIV